MDGQGDTVAKKPGSLATRVSSLKNTTRKFHTGLYTPTCVIVESQP